MPEKKGDFKVDVAMDIPGFVESIQSASDPSAAFPTVVAALVRISVMAAEVWRGFAQGGPIPGTPRVVRMRGGSKYVESILPYTIAPFTTAVRAEAKTTDDIERGKEELDLKSYLLKGPKHRQGVHGAYNIVAFRHDTPGGQTRKNPMPLNIYNIVKTFKPAVATGVDKQTGRLKYNWKGADRLPAKDAQGQRTKLIKDIQGDEKKIAGLKKGYEWKSGKYAGMVHMQDKTTGAKNAGYITFRCVSIRSKPGSWILPAQPGIPIRQAVVDFMRPHVARIIKEALDTDLSMGAK